MVVSIWFHFVELSSKQKLVKVIFFQTVPTLNNLCKCNKTVKIHFSVDQVFASCNGLVSLAPIPPQSLSGVTTDLEPPSDLTFYCASPITSINGEDYPSPSSSCQQPHEDLFSIPMTSEAGGGHGLYFGSSKDLEAAYGVGRRFGRDPVLSSKNFFGMSSQQQQQQQQRQSSPFPHLSLPSSVLSGGTPPTPPPSLSYDGMKFLTECPEEGDEDEEMENSYSLTRGKRMAKMSSPKMKEEPCDSELNSIYNL
jgi:hypothetical protein